MTITTIHDHVKESQLKGINAIFCMTYNEFKEIESDLEIYYPEFETKIGDLVILKIKI